MTFELLANSWWNASIQMTWQAALLFLVIYILDSAFRKLPKLQQMHGAQWRVLLWTVFFVKLMIPAGVSSNWSVWNIFAANATGAVWTPSSSAELARTPNLLINIIFSIWAIGSIGLSLQFWIRSRRFFVHLKQSPSPERGGAVSRAAMRAGRTLKLKSIPQIRWSDTVRVPCVVRPLRPIVILPAHYNDKSETELLHMLLHEFAHISRRDLICEAVARFLTIVYWYHPAVWIGWKRFSHAREISCDLTVARALEGNIGLYQKTLVRLAAETLWVGSRGPAGPVCATGAPTMERLRFIESLTLTKRGSFPFNKSAYAGHLLLAFVAICCVLPAARDDEFAFRVAQANRVIESVASGNRESCLRIQMAARIAFANNQNTNITNQEK